VIPRLPRGGSVEVEVDATPEAVWAVLTDITRVGEWSHECRGAEWLDGARVAAPGARFRGRNLVGRATRWARVCEVRTVDRPREFAWRTFGPRLMGDATEWRVRLEPAGSGTRVRQEFTVVSLPATVDVVIALMIPGHRDRSASLRADLVRLGEVAARVAAQTRSG
jgi:uncharacterized protein YndB with AHSA1/START domain